MVTDKLTKSNGVFEKSDVIELMNLRKRVANSSPKNQQDCLRILNYKMIDHNAANRRFSKNLNMKLEEMDDRFKSLFISKPATCTPIRFYGRQRAERPQLNANIVANRSAMNFIYEKYSDLGTITESKKLINLIFAQNSGQGILFVPRSIYCLMYDAFFELDKRLAGERLTMKLHVDRKIQSILLKHSRYASLAEGEKIPALIRELGAYSILDRKKQVWPDPEFVDSQNLIQRTIDGIQALHERNTNAELTANKIPLKRKSLESFPRMALVKPSILNNDKVILQMKPYFSRKVCLNEVQGFVCMHFDGIHNLSRVHKAIKIAENLEKPLRSFRGTRSAYKTNRTQRKTLNVKSAVKSAVKASRH